MLSQNFLQEVVWKSKININLYGVQGIKWQGEVNRCGNGDGLAGNMEVE